MILDFSEKEWEEFTLIEQRIILLIRKQDVRDFERIRMVLNFPCEPMKETTMRGHWSRIQRKMAKIRLCRIAQNEGKSS